MPTSESHDVARIIANLLARVYELHERMIITTGGIEGLRDAAALHAAVPDRSQLSPARICILATSRKLRHYSIRWSRVAQLSENIAFQPITVAEIAAWFRQLLASADPT